MKKYLDKFKSNIRINKNLFVFLLVIIIIGILSGAIFSLILDGDDKSLVSNYISNFFNSVKDGKFDYDTAIINTLVFTSLFGIIIWLLGISVIGFFIIIFLLFLKSFILGFSVGTILGNFGLKGVLISLIYIFPHQVINLLIFMLLSAYGLIISFKIMRCFCGKKVLDFKNIINRYIKVLVISVIILVITSYYEVYLMPKVLKIGLLLLK